MTTPADTPSTPAAAGAAVTGQAELPGGPDGNVPSYLSHR